MCVYIVSRSNCSRKNVIYKMKYKTLGACGVLP